MKNQIIFTALTLGAIILGTNSVKAQNHTGKTTVNVNLKDVISIDAGSAAIGGTVNLNYNTAEDYNTDQTTTIVNSLKVTSTKKFDVSVKADGENFENGSSKIPVDVMTIKPAIGGTMGGDAHPIVLSTAENQFLVTDAPLGSALTLNLDYTIPASKSSTSDILGKPAGTYTQTVTYTVIAK